MRAEAKKKKKNRNWMAPRGRRTTGTWEQQQECSLCSTGRCLGCCVVVAAYVGNFPKHAAQKRTLFALHAHTAANLLQSCRTIPKYQSCAKPNPKQNDSMCHASKHRTRPCGVQIKPYTSSYENGLDTQSTIACLQNG